MDGCSRQNPAYRLAKGKPRSGGAFLCLAADRTLSCPACRGAMAPRSTTAAPRWTDPARARGPDAVTPLVLAPVRLRRVRGLSATVRRDEALVSRTVAGRRRALLSGACRTGRR